MSTALLIVGIVIAYFIYEFIRFHLNFKRLRVSEISTKQLKKIAQGHTTIVEYTSPGFHRVGELEWSSVEKIIEHVQSSAVVEVTVHLYFALKFIRIRVKYIAMGPCVKQGHWHTASVFSDRLHFGIKK